MFIKNCGTLMETIHPSKFLKYVLSFPVLSGMTANYFFNIFFLHIL